MNMLGRICEHHSDIVDAMLDSTFPPPVAMKFLRIAIKLERWSKAVVKTGRESPID
jgi:hypothetical protein